MAVALMDKAAGQAKLPETPAVVALFAFGSRLDRDTMQLFARTHSEEVRAAAIASTGQEVLELLHGGLRPQVLVLDALLTKPAVTQVLQEIGKMDLKPQPAVLVLVPVPEETAAAAEDISAEPAEETPVTKAPAAPEPEAYSVDEILREVHGGAPQADSAPTPAAPVYSGARVLERLLEDPEKLASDLDALTRAIQGLSDDLRRGAAESREGQVDR